MLRLVTTNKLLLNIVATTYMPETSMNSHSQRTIEPRV
jgi:hypothetical protein